MTTEKKVSPTLRSEWRQRVTTLRITLLLAMALVVATCSSSKPAPSAGGELVALRAEIAGLVDDPAREAKMLGAVDDIEQALVALGNLVARQRTDSARLARDYGTPREDLEAAFNGYMKERRVVADALADAHFRLKELATAEEWGRLAKKERGALSWAAERHLGTTPISEP